MAKIIPANRTKNIKYAIRDVVVEAKKLEKIGKKILYLNIGDPIKFDFETPKHMLATMQKNIKNSGYMDSLGIEEARVSIAKNCGIKQIQSDDVLITTGVTEGIRFALEALVNSGENILTPSPGYPVYTGLINALDLDFNEYYLDEEDNWHPDLDNIRKKINKKTKGIVLINPNNPTGGIYNKKIVKGIIDIAAEHELLIFSDEIYDKLILDDENKHVSTACLSKDVPVLTFNGLSKSYLGPGLRCGWVIFHDPIDVLGDYKEAMNKLARVRLSAPSYPQFMIKPALEGSQKHLVEVRKKLRKRRDITYKRLNEISGISCVKPLAAFYAFPKINLKIKSDEKFVYDLLHETGVLVVHGSGFGEKPGTKHFRIVYLPKPNILNQAFDKIEKFIKKNYKNK